MALHPQRCSAAREETVNALLSGLSMIALAAVGVGVVLAILGYA